MHYLARLEGGASRRDIARELAGSDEHLDRIAEPGEHQERLASPFLDACLSPGTFSPWPSSAEVTSGYEQLALGAPVGVDVPIDRMLALVDAFQAYHAELPFADDHVPGLRFKYANGSFNHFDAVALFCTMRHFRPRRIIEVGSGWSSALMLDTCERFLPDTKLTFVDPDLGRLRALLNAGDTSRCDLVESAVQAVPRESFDVLAHDDILFVDSSHVARFGSDVVHLVLDVFPTLAPGVIVHVHDIFWNFEYPREWLLEGRPWNEAYLLRAFLAHNAAFEVLLFNDYVARFHWDHLASRLPIATTPAPGSPFRNAGVSLWMRRRVGSASAQAEARPTRTRTSRRRRSGRESRPRLAADGTEDLRSQAAPTCSAGRGSVATGVRPA